LLEAVAVLRAVKIAAVVRVVIAQAGTTSPLVEAHQQKVNILYQRHQQ
jgi:hypothetical protein